MKLNHRDRILICIVMVAAVWLLGIFFFIVPAFKDLGTAKDELNDRQVVLSQKNEEIEKDKDLPKRIDEAYAQSEELAKNIYDFTTTQNATDTVDKLLDENKIVNSTMQINEYSVKTLKPFYYVSKLKVTEFDVKVDEYESMGSKADKSKTDSSKAGTGDSSAIVPKQQSITNDDGSVFTIDPNQGVPIGCYNIQLSCRGKFSDIQDFCEKLSKNIPSSMVLATLDITTVNEDVIQKEEEEKSKEGEGGASASSSKKEDGKSDKKGVEVYDDNTVDANIAIDLMVIKKLSKPE